MQVWVSYPDRLHSHQVNGVDIWVTHPNQDPEILVLGDSHAEQYLERVYDLSKKTGKVAGFMAVAGCYTIKGVGNDKGGQCSKQPQAIEKLLQHEKLETILFSYIWGRYYKEHPNSFEEGLNQMIDLQQQQSHRNFFVLLDPPWDSGSYDIRRYAGASFNRLFSDTIPYDQFIVDLPKETIWRQGNNAVIDRLKDHITIIDIEHLVCPNQKCNLLV